ncbi:hypothetical protein RX327_02815 [Bradyrhizobium sp. BEA-2-5]|uniref:hypothetical protein n=1 Tax=Bradyrhizobium sp. BEA-2-5 TaxID=3080015 RepID=UPI00293EA31F|nr:hypothetical protein [Bradyrhizobium sp. BEA-2-5]WOH82148.1 hypothetical protein RX327_02815 [Bradyrhizobium sp. BEA-2-5]
MTERPKPKKAESLEIANAKRKAGLSLETAAYKEKKRRLGNAWKTSEFENAMYFAGALKIMEPLASFLESKAILRRSDRLALARFVRSFAAPKPGRPIGRVAGDSNEAQRNAVYLVRLGQQCWRKESKRQRVPASVTNELIVVAIKEALKAFPKAKISPDDVRALVNKASRKIVD